MTHSRSNRCTCAAQISPSVPETARNSWGSMNAQGRQRIEQGAMVSVLATLVQASRSNVEGMLSLRGETILVSMRQMAVLGALSAGLDKAGQVKLLGLAVERESGALRH